MTDTVQAEGDGVPLNVNHNYDSAIVSPPILAVNFNCSYLYEFLVHGGLFGGLPHEDPILHIKNFLSVCALHKQLNVSDDALRLRLFPFSLQGKARTWLGDLPARSIHNWDELLQTFLGEFLPPRTMVKLRSDILNFKQKPLEALHDAWVRYKKCLIKCPQHECTDVLLLRTFYFALDKVNQSLADNVANGAILKLTFPPASAILDKVAEQAHAWHPSGSAASYGSSNSTIFQEKDARDETIAQLSTQITLLTKQISEMMAEKVHAVESSSGYFYNASPKCAYYVGQGGQLQEQYNHVQEEDANYVSSYQGGHANYVSSYQGGLNQQTTNYQGGQDHHQNQQRPNHQGGQDHNQGKPLQQWNSNQGWNNQQNNQGWSANNQGNRGAGSSQAYNASRPPMYQQGNQPPPYHNQGQHASLSKDNYEQTKEAIDFLQPGSSKDKPIGKNFQEKRMQVFQLDVDASASFSAAAQQKHAKLDNFLEVPPTSTYCLHAFLNFDGSSKGNPGPAGAGAVLRAADGSMVFRLREGLGVATNNVSEYKALILGLKYALEKGFKHIQVQGDSQLVCMQTQGLWKTKNQNMVELSKIVKELKDQFMSFLISHVERELNNEADAQANLAVHLKNGETQVECDMK